MQYMLTGRISEKRSLKRSVTFPSHRVTGDAGSVLSVRAGHGQRDIQIAPVQPFLDRLADAVGVAQAVFV